MKGRTVQNLYALQTTEHNKKNSVKSFIILSDLEKRENLLPED